MPQAKKPHRIASSPRKQPPKGQMTHEAIAADIDAFRDKGVMTQRFLHRSGR